MAKNIFRNAMERNALFALLAVGILGSVVGAMSSERFWFSYLQNALFMLTLALGAVLFIAFKSVSNAGWATVLRRVPEAMMAYVPIGGLCLLLVYFGRNTLYP